MLKYAKEKWAENNDKLRKVIEETPKDERCSWEYEDILRLIIQNVLNPGSVYHFAKLSNNFHVINDGSYQGTLIFLMYRECYQPSIDDYLITFVEYGSCSGCDTLQGIQSDEYWVKGDPVSDYMALCKDIVTNLKHPFDTYLKMEEVEVDE